jgi:hypothetical protein
VFEWQRLAICCVRAGETSLSVMKEETARRRPGLVRLACEYHGEPPVYSARAITPRLAGREILFDPRRVFGIRWITSDLPKDFGLRSIFGRLPQPG